MPSVFPELSCASRADRPLAPSLLTLPQDNGAEVNIAAQWNHAASGEEVVAILLRGHVAHDALLAKVVVEQLGGREPHEKALGLEINPRAKDGQEIARLLEGGVDVERLVTVITDVQFTKIGAKVLEPTLYPNGQVGISSVQWNAVGIAAKHPKGLGDPNLVKGKVQAQTNLVVAQRAVHR